MCQKKLHHCFKESPLLSKKAAGFFYIKTKRGVTIEYKFTNALYLTHITGHMVDCKNNEDMRRKIFQKTRIYIINPRKQLTSNN